MTDASTVSMRAGGATLEVVRGDITAQTGDALVAPADHRLSGNSGPVDRAVHAIAGPSLIEETRRRSPQGCEVGDAVLTGGGRLRVKWVIQAVVPPWTVDRAMPATAMLRTLWARSLRLAAGRNCATVVAAALGVSENGFPVEDAASVAVKSAVEHLRAGSALRVLRWVVYDARTLAAWENALHMEIGPDGEGRAAVPGQGPEIVAGAVCAEPLCRCPLPPEANYCPRCGRRVPGRR